MFALQPAHLDLLKGSQTMISKVRSYGVKIHFGILWKSLYLDVWAFQSRLSKVILIRCHNMRAEKYTIYLMVPTYFGKLIRAQDKRFIWIYVFFLFL